MLHISATNQAASSNNLGYCGYGASNSCSSSTSASGASSIGFGSSAGMMLDDDDIMDPLFDEDWLHENNLDILFDLFEEEIESKGVESNHCSSTLFGTSPVTSYLFGTSPSLVSALDLPYFDDQLQQLQPNQIVTQQPSIVNNNSSDVTINQQQHQAVATSSNRLDDKNNVSTKSITSLSKSHVGIQQVDHKNYHAVMNANCSNVGSTSNSITQAMRIKRGLKRGQSEGVSLLARPSSATSNNGKNNNNSGCINNNCSSSSIGSSNNNIAKAINIGTIFGAANSNGGSKIIVTKNNGDKTSAKITNFKNSILGKNDNNKVTNGVEINNSRQNQNYRYHKYNCQQHVHNITGRAVIREHAYAVRGH